MRTIIAITLGLILVMVIEVKVTMREVFEIKKMVECECQG